MTTSASDGRVDFPLLFKLQADLSLGGIRSGFPSHVVDFRGGTEVIFRGAVAIEAPGHTLWLVLVDDLHFIDRPMAAVAAHATVHVHGVVEVSVVGNLVDADPVDRFARLPALAHGGEFWTVGFDLGVAGHAGLRGRDIRVRGDLDKAMAVAAVHAELLHVNDVRERNGLRGLVTNPRVFGSEVIGEPSSNRGDQHTRANDQLQGKPVRPFWKSICH